MSDLTNVRFHDFEAIKREFLKYAPAYAQNEAALALDKIEELQAQRLIRNGVYYIVLVDLVGSTEYGVKHGNERLNARVKAFIRYSFSALAQAELKNVGLFVKEIGDAVLFIFQHFPDIVRWRIQLDGYMRTIALTDEPVVIRTVVHLGEVYLEGVNPLSLAVSQTFKMEKSVRAGELVLSDPAYHVAWPTIARAYQGFESYGEISVPGFARPLGLHRLVLHDESDLQRIIEESLDFV